MVGIREIRFELLGRSTQPNRTPLSLYDSFLRYVRQENRKPVLNPIFEIYAGEDRRRFLAHAGILSKSEALKALIEGRWKESGEKEIVWKDWDGDTVDRFLQWIYTGDYKFPHPTPGTTSKENRSGELDYEATLLASAKVYAIANYFMLPELKTLAIQRLQNTLNLIRRPVPKSERAHIAPLIEYVYAHTDRLTNEEEPLRKLVTTFAASNHANLQGPMFQTLMSDGGDFVLDLVARLTQRLSCYEDCEDDFETGEGPKDIGIFPYKGRLSKNKKGRASGLI